MLLIVWAMMGPYGRDTRYLNTRITADSRDGWPGSSQDAYRLAVARACPWANRAMDGADDLVGLESMNRWPWPVPCTRARAELELRPGPGRTRMPCSAWGDRGRPRRRCPATTAGSRSRPSSTCQTGGIIRDDYRQMTRWTWDRVTAQARDGAPNLLTPRGAGRGSTRSAADRLRGRERRCLPGRQRELTARVRGGLPRVVQAAGLASERLADQRYLFADTITEADIRLFTTLARFTPSTTATSSATGPNCRRCRCCGPTRATCSRRRGSATRSTSSRSRSTTTGCTCRSTRPGSSRPAGSVQLADAARAGGARRPPVRRWDTAPAAASRGDRAARPRGRLTGPRPASP